MRQIREMEDKELKREGYIKGIEKQLRQVQEEKDKIENQIDQYDREIYSKMKELEGQMQLVNE